MHPSFLLLIGGTSLCLVKFMISTALVLVFSGLGAIRISLFALFFPSAPAVQIFLWMLLSAVLAWLGHWFRPRHTAIDFSHPEARALTAIGRSGSTKVMFMDPRMVPAALEEIRSVIGAVKSNTKV
jgi:membrane protein implicated in regulation of membrane protease activity